MTRYLHSVHNIFCIFGVFEMGVEGEYYPLTASGAAHLGNAEAALLRTMKLNCVLYMHVHRS
jgi:hypothetical protein